jgi:acetyltransferase-like isoleucine patch superfamily enzyme
VRFDKSGELLGYRHSNETYWAIQSERLVFLSSARQVTSRSGEISLSDDGKYSVVMLREDDQSARAHLLVESHGIIDFTQVASLGDLVANARQHRAFAGACRLGEVGYSPPSINNIESIQVNESTLPRLSELGLKVMGPYEAGNTVIIDPSMRRVDLTIRFHGKGFNSIILDRECRVRGALSFEGSENIVVIGAAAADRDISVSATFRYDACGLVLGAGGSAGQINIWIEGPGHSIQIGDDFLFSWGIWIRTADSHGLVDLDTGTLVNSSRSILIGPHVWLGQDVMVMPGAKIGGGAVVGARSVVTKKLPASCVAVGAPARVVRRKTSWTRSAAPAPEEISALQAATFQDE